jgi:GT2 family glycosyltransferase
MPVTLVFPVESNKQLILHIKYQKYLFVSTGELAYKQDIGRAIDCPVRIAYYWKPDVYDAVRGDTLPDPTVSVIIVNWNGKHLLTECIESLRTQTFRDFEIVLVDNGSSDGSAEFVKMQYPEVRLIILPENRGFAGGNNAGIKVSLGQYVALLNNDTKADPDWLSSLIKTTASDQHVGMWASKILSYYSPNVIDNTGLLLYWDGLARGRGRLEVDRGQFDQQREVLFPSGCAGLYRKVMLDDIGSFDEDFFAYADDVDLGLRGRLAGWGCAYVPGAVVYHKYSSSSSAYSPMKAFLVERNRIWVLLKYYPIELVLLSPYFTFKRLVLSLYGALTGRGASGKFAAQNSLVKAGLILLKAWCAALKDIPGIMRWRREFRSKKRIGWRSFYRLHRRFSLSTAEIALKE